MGDPYMSSYYGMSFPYQNLGLGEGAWSNGSETMTFLSSYGGQMGSEQHSHYVDSMLSGGGFGGFGQPGFNYFPGNGDYSAWGTSSLGRKPNSHGHYDDYYRDVYSEQSAAAAAAAAADRADLKPVEQGMQALGLSDKMDPSKMVDCKGGPGDFKEGGGGGGMIVTAAAVAGPGGGGVGLGVSQAPKKMTWASIASQPAKPQPKMKPKGIPPAPMLPGKHNMDIGTWESKNGSSMKASVALPAPRPAWGAPRVARGGGAAAYGNPPVAQVTPQTVAAAGGGPGGSQSGYPNHPVLDKLRQSNEYNPKEFDMQQKNARFFIIKSYSEDDIHRSIKYGIWCSTEHGNKRLDLAYRDQESKGPLYLFFSVNGSGHFCGMAQMTSEVDYNATSNVWAQDKWKGEFKVKWVYVKDVPNSQLRHIRLENNENKPVTNSRDTQEVPADKGRMVLKVIHMYRHTTSIFDDFVHYEKRQEEEDQRKVVHPHPGAVPPPAEQNSRATDGKQ